MKATWAWQSGRTRVLCALLFVLSACGGSDGGSPPPATYAIGGSLSGLAAGQRATLQNNGADDLVVSADGVFTFAAQLAQGASYHVTVQTAPVGQTCRVANGSGVVGATNVSNVAVTCVASTYAVGGTVTGLASGASLVLQNNGTDDLSRVANGAFVFATALAQGASYLVTVRTQPAGQNCSVARGSGTIGTANVDDVAVACSNTNKAWGTATLIETNNAGPAAVPQIAVGASGVAFAVWKHYPSPATGFGNPSQIWANRYQPGAGWGVPQRVQSSDEPADEPQVAVDASGNAFVVWSEFDPGVIGSTNITRIWANRYTAGQGWGTAQPIESGADTAFAPQIGVDANGNAIAVWNQRTALTVYDVSANRYTAGAGWGAAVEISPGSASRPQLGVAANGDAFVVFHRGSDVWAARFAAGAWATAVSIAANGRDPRVAVSSGGDAMVIWPWYDGTRYSIHSARFEAHHIVFTGWQAAELIASDPVNEFTDLSLAFDDHDQAYATWTRFDDGRNKIFAVTRPSLTMWGTVVMIDSGSGGAAFAQVAVSPQGDAFAIWQQDDGTRTNIWSNRRPPGGPWGTAELVETNDAGPAFGPRIAVDSEGNAIAVWRQRDGTRDDIWANRFR